MATFDPTRGSYLNLATFRKSGAEVRTPVWFAVDADDPRLLWIYTNGQSGKVKRIRANGRAAVAACDVRGKLRSDFVTASAELVSGQPEEARGWQALREKYGLQLQLVLLGSRLGGTHRHRALLAVRLRDDG
jgi:PPOX class probable F420-dependent enzyme